ncbi:MAG: CCA tRNA nucleotidyltransferase, mitochondrial [Caeruleum heppii]|nr:MAG: CCA tRNA nucleotidyltransferase, mitochondrial [Caeruleum heppii]
MVPSLDMAQIDVGQSLQLTALEARLRDLLLDVARYIDQRSTLQTELPSSTATNVELRFTGGWVRDKLLGVDSHDIDVAINTMTGYEFGLQMKEYLERPGMYQKYGIQRSSDLHKIEANPDKSKHLETVTTRVLGLDIDLVNLRKEAYTDDSRNPQMEFGTPLEDALRRDATVNAMFFNLNTSALEDWTGQGLQDLRTGIIRTPLDPQQTFKDDPLRILRLIRFASRLGYLIEGTAEAAMSQPAIQDALRVKISRERIGIEIEKMLRGSYFHRKWIARHALILDRMTGNDPRRALRLIDRLGLYTTVFSDPSHSGGSPLPIQNWSCAYECAQLLVAGSREVTDDHRPESEAAARLSRALIDDASEEYLVYLLSALTPWGDKPASPTAKPTAKTAPPVAAVVAREGIKINNKVYKLIESACVNASDIMSVKQSVSETLRGQTGAVSRDVLGMAIRRWGEKWRLQVVFCILLETMRSGLDNVQGRKIILADYASFVDCVRELDLMDVWKLKPLLDGKELSRALRKEPGPWMKGALELLIAWQLRNGDSRDVESAVAELEQHVHRRE